MKLTFKTANAVSYFTFNRVEEVEENKLLLSQIEGDFTLDRLYWFRPGMVCESDDFRYAVETSTVEFDRNNPVLTIIELRN